ncbi:MAG: DUF5077 domain-containing protein, partial [Cyclobacteriaceae bacterium]
HRDIYRQEQAIGQEMAAAYGKIQKNINEEGTMTKPSIPVGYKQAPVVAMPAHEATLHQGLQYKEGNGWANDWIVNWTATAAYASWPIEVVEAGNYQVFLKYNTPDGPGATVQVTIGKKSIETTIDEPFAGEQIESPDRVPRKEVYERTWGNLEVGTMQLEPGAYELRVTASGIPNQSAMELKGVELIRID